MTVSFQYGLRITAFTCCTVQFSPAQTLTPLPGCSLYGSGGISHETWGRWSQWWLAGSAVDLLWMRRFAWAAATNRCSGYVAPNSDVKKRWASTNRSAYAQ